MPNGATGKGKHEMVDALEWPSLEACGERSSLLIFHNIHCGVVSIEKDKYLTPAHSSRSTRSLHSPPSDNNVDTIHIVML